MKKIITIISICFALTACAAKPIVHHAKVYPSLQNLRVHYATKLAANGVEIQRVGQTYIFTIPSQLLFFSDSANFHLHAHKVLLTMAKFIRSYRTVNIRVAAFSGKFKTAKIQTSLAKLQAVHVVNAMWKIGLDARLVYSEGFNSRDNVHGKPHVDIKFRVYPYPYAL